MKNFVLESAPGTFGKNLPDSMQRTKKDETEKYRRLAVELTGSDDLPAVLYKGRHIAAGKFGTRQLND